LRRGFGLIYALFVIVLVAGLISLALRYAKSSIVKTTDIYEKESAELFLNSAVELSLLAISGYKRSSTNGCLKDINITSNDKRFIAKVHIKWYYLTGGSNDALYCANDNMTHIITTEDSQGMAMLEVEVDSNDTNPKNSIPLRIIGRTLQRP
jgi:hypothetical protein